MTDSPIDSTQELWREEVVPPWTHRNYLESVFVELRRLIESKAGERELAALFRVFPRLLCLLWDLPPLFQRRPDRTFCREVPLGDEFRLDFAFGYREGSGCCVTEIVEIKDPGVPLLKGDGKPSAALNDGVHQLRGYLDWINQNKAYAKRRGIIGDEGPVVHGTLIIGHRLDSTLSDLNRLRSWLSQAPGTIEVMSWDRLRDKADEAICDLNGSRFRQYIIEEAAKLIKCVDEPILASMRSTAIDFLNSGNPTGIAAHTVVKTFSHLHRYRPVLELVEQEPDGIVARYLLQYRQLDRKTFEAELRAQEQLAATFHKKMMSELTERITKAFDCEELPAKVEYLTTSLTAIATCPAANDLLQPVCALLSLVTLDEITPMYVRFYANCLDQTASTSVWPLGE